MSIRKLRVIPCAVLTAAFFSLLLGCGVHVNEDKGEKKNVDITTPMGSLHVRTEIDPKDTGLDPYPGAVRDEDHEHQSANVSMSSGLFGLKVVAARFRTDDPPDKVIAFYTKQLDKYGTVLNCPNGVVERKEFAGDKGSTDEPIRCRDTREPGRVAGETDLAVGTTDHQHLVNVKPDGKGAKFALVYVQAHGHDETM